MADHPHITEFERKLAENVERRKRVTRERLERQEHARQAVVQIVLRTSAAKRDCADKACVKLRGMSLASWFAAEIDTYAASPEGYISEKDRLRRGYKLSGSDNLMLERELSLRIEQYKDNYNDEFTMNDLHELWNDEPGVFDRRTATVVGYIMKNLGYRKVRTRIPATEYSPTRLVWIYRKEEPTWAPPSTL